MVSIARPGRTALWSTISGLAVLLALSVLTRPIDHDESQYVAATALMRLGWPYRDFAYLQTPLQPLLLAPLAWLHAGWLLVASRIVNMLLGAATLVLIAIAVRGKVRAPAMLIAVAACACSDVFLLASSEARNDALPMVLLAGAIAVLMRPGAAANERWRFALAGLCLGLAISAKISAALPAAGAGLFIALESRRLGSWRPLALTAAGGVLGLTPTLLLAAAAPRQFMFDVVGYSLHAPQQWWPLAGHPEWLTVAAKLRRIVMFAWRGPMLLALALAVAGWIRRDRRTLLLDLMIAGGLVAAFMPSPTFGQYLVPLLPPLFARLAFVIDSAGERWRRPLLLTLSLTAIYGLVVTARDVALTLRQSPELIDAVRDGTMVAQVARCRSLATLSPEIVAGSDVDLDRRFAAGPFLFRTQGPLSAAVLRLAFSPNWQNSAALDRAPPGVILVGEEAAPHPPLHPFGLDGHLSDWARRHGYRAQALGARRLTLWLAPDTKRAAPAGPPDGSRQAVDQRE